MIEHVQTVLVWKDPEKELPAGPCECLLYSPEIDCIIVGAWNGNDFVELADFLYMYGPHSSDENLFVMPASVTLYAVLPDKSRIEKLLDSL